jgi:hypothetical protein
METLVLTEQEFDCVKFMRDVRDKLSKDIENMTLEQENEYLTKTIETNKRTN